MGKGIIIKYIVLTYISSPHTATNYISRSTHPQSFYYGPSTQQFVGIYSRTYVSSFCVLLWPVLAHSRYSPHHHVETVSTPWTKLYSLCTWELGSIILMSYSPNHMLCWKNDPMVFISSSPFSVCFQEFGQLKTQVKKKLKKISFIYYKQAERWR